MCYLFWSWILPCDTRSNALTLLMHWLLMWCSGWWNNHSIHLGNYQLGAKLIFTKGFGNAGYYQQQQHRVCLSKQGRQGELYDTTFGCKWFFPFVSIEQEGCLVSGWLDCNFNSTFTGRDYRATVFPGVCSIQVHSVTTVILTTTCHSPRCFYSCVSVADSRISACINRGKEDGVWCCDRGVCATIITYNVHLSIFIYLYPFVYLSR